MQHAYRLAALGGLLLSALGVRAQVGIGITTPHASALLDLTSTTRGLLVPRMSATQRGLIGSPAPGLLVYQNDGTTPGFWLYNGAAWAPMSRATDLALPFSGAASISNLVQPVFSISNTASTTGVALNGSSDGTSGIGVRGFSSQATGTGVAGIAQDNGYASFPTNTGVAGVADTGIGVYGGSVSGDAVVGRKPGSATFVGRAGMFDIQGNTNDSTALRAVTAGGGSALVAYRSASTGTRPALVGKTASTATGAIGVLAWAGGSSGLGSQTIALQAINDNRSSLGYAIAAEHHGRGTAIVGSCPAGTGVRGDSDTYNGVIGTSNGATGVSGSSDTGSGVVGTTNGLYGVRGTASSWGTGVLGESAQGVCIRGTKFAANTGTVAEFVNGNSANPDPTVNIENNSAAPALQVSATNGAAGKLTANSSVTTPTLRLEESQDDYARLSFYNSSGSSYWTVAGLPATANSNAFLNFYYSGLGNAMTVRGNGNVTVSGALAVTGTLSKGGGSFKIDHPLDPANQYLYHSFVESPDMLNMYNGNATLDAHGEAEVQLPDWFEALNRDFRYQLTAVGAPGPNLHVAQKVSQHRFRIAGGTPGGEVSWQVTGIRQDNWANQNRIPVEQAKEPENRGRYLHPAAFGLPASRGLVAPTQAETPAAAAPATAVQTRRQP